ncbi:MAG: hypothetical protein ACP5HU_08965 [Phycisphaerae bacterium]
MIRNTILAALVFLALSAVTVAQVSDDIVGTGASRRTHQAEPAATGLERELDDVDFDGIPLEDCIDFLRDASGVNIFVNWDALGCSGISRDDPVELQLRNVTIKHVLDLICKQHVMARLGYVVDDGTVILSTREDLATYTVTEIYDVADLVAVDDTDQVENLINLITQTIEPETWRPAGDVGGAVFHRGTLAVRHTRPAQAQVRDLLEKLREAAKERPPTPRALTERTRERTELVGSMKQTVQDSESMGLIAVSGIRDDVPREPAEVIEDLEAMLKEVRTLSLRNAIRLALKDLYRNTGQQEKAIEHLRHLLLENDAAMSGEAGQISRDSRDTAQPTPSRIGPRYTGSAGSHE